MEAVEAQGNSGAISREGSGNIRQRHCLSREDSEAQGERQCLSRYLLPTSAPDLAVDETVIPLHPPLPLAGVSIVMERERQQNDSLVGGYPDQINLEVAGQWLAT